MDRQKETTREIAHHIFSGSTTMIGVCITVITLIIILHKRFETVADEILSVDALLFIVSTFISYLSLRRNNNRKLEWIADGIFFIAMLLMVIVGMILVYVEA